VDIRLDVLRSPLTTAWWTPGIGRTITNIRHQFTDGTQPQCRPPTYVRSCSPDRRRKVGPITKFRTSSVPPNCRFALGLISMDFLRAPPFGKHDTIWYCSVVSRKMVCDSFLPVGTLMQKILPCCSSACFIQAQEPSEHGFRIGGGSTSSLGSGDPCHLLEHKK